MFVAVIYAQPPEGRQLPKIGTITGKVIDFHTEKPMEYTNIVLHKTRDSAMVDGVITEKDGTFEMSNVPPGRFYVEADFMGYTKKIVDTFKITPDQRKMELGTIKLVQADKNIEGVDVVADKSRVQYKVDKKVVNVDQDLVSSGGSAVNVLENVPSVEVDIEGNVSLRGSSDFRVLIDGKPTVLDGSDALKQIPATAVEKIELITNPSAKYDPEGTAGIINIIMKDNKKAGLNGLINASVGLRDKYSGDFKLNYELGKFKVFAGAQYRNYTSGGENHGERETYRPDIDSTFYLNSDGERDMIRSGYSVNSGFDYNINDKSTLTFSAKYGKFGFGFDNTSNNHSYWGPLNGDAYTDTTRNDYYITEGGMSIDNNYVNFNLSYDKQFDEKQHKLKASLHYSNSSGDDESPQEEYDANSDFEKLGQQATKKVRTYEESKEDEFRLKVDYTKPLSDGELEAGYQARYRYNNQDYTYENYNYDNSRWVPVQPTHTMALTRHIQAVYSTFNWNIGDFGFQAGLRGEYTNRLLNQKTNDEKFRIDRFDIFPTAHTKYQLPAKQQLMLSYSRRIRRPRGWNLDPFETYQDKNNRRKGNPELEPSYTDSYELSYQKRFGKSFVSLEGYYRLQHNDISRIQRPGEGNIMIHTFDNLNRNHSMGAELMGNLELKDWWRLNISGDVYRYRLEGTVESEDEEKTSNNWDARLNNTFRFNNNKTKVQINSFYRGPSITAQGTREGFFASSVSFKQEFFDRKASVTLNVRDVFQSMEFESTSEGQGFYSERQFSRESPVIRLSFSYRINNYKEKRGPREQGGGAPGAEGMQQGRGGM